jgi:hypothetical protein
MSSDYNPCNFDEAEKLAKAEAKRIVQMDDHAVRYIKFDPVLFKDYCRVDIVFDATGRGAITLRMLPLDERQSDEHLTDEHIAGVARAGHLLDAMRLYRLLHSADLATAKIAVESMIERE